MKRIRLTIGATMAGIAYLGLAFAALSKPSPVWTEAWTTLTLASLTVAVIGAAYSRGQGRATCGGLAVAGGVVAAVGLFPGAAPRLLTHRLVEGHYRTTSHVPRSVGESVWVESAGKFYEGRVNDPGTAGTYLVSFATPSGRVTKFLAPLALRPISPEGYQQLCHMILAPIVGLFGAFVARFFASGRGETNP